MTCKRWVPRAKGLLYYAPYNYFSKLWNLNRACEKFNLEHIYVTAQALDKDKSENFILYSSSSCKTYCLFSPKTYPYWEDEVSTWKRSHNVLWKKKWTRHFLWLHLTDGFSENGTLKEKVLGKHVKKIVWSYFGCY